MFLNIADITFSIVSDYADDRLALDPACEDFRCENERDPEALIHVSYDGLPDIELSDDDLIFDSEVHWRLYRHDAQRIFTVSRQHESPHRIAVFNQDFTEGKVYTHASELPDDPSEKMPDPLGYPISELLMINMLGKGRGVLVHSCGIDINGDGYLFAGNSTNGKSTLAELWKDRAEVLNDDRIVIRFRDGQFWMYGTPWHGDYSAVMPHGVPLKKIFFISHAVANKVERVSPMVALSMLIVRSFPPQWDKDGMDYTLDLSARIVESIPCYTLGFIPDDNIIDYVVDMG